MKYHEDEVVKQEIDAILARCATIFSNLGTKTDLDLGSKDAARAEERRLLDKIKDLDEEFYNDRLLAVSDGEEEEQENTEQEGT